MVVTDTEGGDRHADSLWQTQTYRHYDRQRHPGGDRQSIGKGTQEETHSVDKDTQTCRLMLYNRHCMTDTGTQGETDRQTNTTTDTVWQTQAHRERQACEQPWDRIGVLGLHHVIWDPWISKCCCYMQALQIWRSTWHPTWPQLQWFPWQLMYPSPTSLGSCAVPLVPLVSDCSSHHTCTYTHTHTQTHTRVHTYTHTHMHASLLYLKYFHSALAETDQFPGPGRTREHCSGEVWGHQC